MNEVAEEFERTCSNCGTDLQITVYEDETYTGGHFWDLDFDEHGELWECDDCFEESQ